MAFQMVTFSQGGKVLTLSCSERLVLHLQNTRQVIFLGNSNTARDSQKLRLDLGIVDKVIATLNKNHSRPLLWTKLLC